MPSARPCAPRHGESRRVGQHRQTWSLLSGRAHSRRQREALLPPAHHVQAVSGAAEEARGAETVPADKRQVLARAEPAAAAVRRGGCEVVKAATLTQPVLVRRVIAVLHAAHPAERVVGVWGRTGSATCALVHRRAVQRILLGGGRDRGRESRVALLWIITARPIQGLQPPSGITEINEAGPKAFID